MSWFLLSSGKSGKREVAVSLLMFWAFCFGYVMFWLPADLIAKYEGILDTLTWTVLAWAAAAFGVDFVMKGMAARQATQISTTRRQPRDNAENYTGSV